MKIRIKTQKPCIGYWEDEGRVEFSFDCFYVLKGHEPRSAAERGEGRVPEVSREKDLTLGFGWGAGGGACNPLLPLLEMLPSTEAYPGPDTHPLI